MSFELADFAWWHPAQMRFDSTMIAIAPTGQGKTTFILDCLRKGGTKRGMVVCPSPECYKTYGKHFPMLFCHDQLDQKLEAQLEDILAYQEVCEFEAIAESETIMARMETGAQRWQEEKWQQTLEALKTRALAEGWSLRKCQAERARAERERDEQNAYLQRLRTARYLEMRDKLREKHSWTIVWDDLSNQPGALDKPIIEKSVKAGRHYIEKQFYACQGVRDFKCKNRDQIAWLAMSPMVSTSRVKAFMEDWIPPGFEKPSEFTRILKMFANEGLWLVIDRRPKSRDPTRFIYRYKAAHTMFPKADIGCPAFLYAHELFFDAEKAQKRLVRVQPGTVRAAAAAAAAAASSHNNPNEKTSKTKRKTTASASGTSNARKRSGAKKDDDPYRDEDHRRDGAGARNRGETHGNDDDDSSGLHGRHSAVNQAMNEQSILGRQQERQKARAAHMVQILQNMGRPRDRSTPSTQPH